MGRIQGKAALILGASATDNLGQQIARRFVAEGARVMVAGRRDGPLKELAAETGCAWRACDIAKPDEVTALVAAAMQEFGRIDIAVNASGWGLIKPFLDHTTEDLDQMNAVQFRGPYQFWQALLRVMQQGGSLIQISSVTATIMFNDHAAYMGTKAGMDHVMRCIAHEFGGQGIRANSIAPGGIQDTPMSNGGLHVPAVAALYNREIPLGRPGVAADVVNAAVFLASDEASFITGQVLQVNGGQTLRRNPSLAEVMGALGLATG